MSRCRKLSLFLLLTAFVTVPRSARADFPLPTYDLESLCYMSTDVVEATLTRHHIAGQEECKDVFTAAVITSIAGHRNPGDQIGPFDPINLFMYGPAKTGQRCIVFLSPHAQPNARPAPTSAPYCKDRVEDMLLIDKHNRVRRYYQQSYPGCKIAEGYVVCFHDGEPYPQPFYVEDDTKEQSYLTLTSERIDISTEWEEVNRLRPLLDHAPRQEDIPALQALVEERRQTSDTRQQNIIEDIARQRLADLHAGAD